MQALGNDFMVLYLDSLPTWTAKQIQQLADRRLGIGFDQCLVIKARTEPTHFDYIIYNADGSEASQCLNGARCIAHFLDDRHQAPGQIWTLHTQRDTITVQTLTSGKVQAQGKLNCTKYQCKLPWHYVDVGNQHALMPVDSVNNLPIPADQLQRMMQTHNVGFFSPRKDKVIQLRVFERGAGETPACGSAALACAIMLWHQQHSSHPLCIVQAGGTIEASIDEQYWRLMGEAHTVFSGKLQSNESFG